MTAPVQPTPLSDADYWESLVASGTPKDEATRMVLARRGAPGAAGMPQHGAVQTAADNAANSILFGLGPRLQALTASLVNSPHHNTELYHFYLAALQKQGQANAAAHPVAATGGTLAGAVASPLNQLLPTGGASTAAKIIRTAAGGALAGAAQGAGSAAYGQTAQGALQGAGAGGVLGGALGTVPAIAGALRNPFTATGRLASTVASSGGAQALKAEAERLASLGKGGSTMLADLSAPLRALADHIATVSDEARDVIGGATAARQGEQAGRVLSDVRAGLRGVDPSVATRQAALEESRRAWAGPAYDALRAANPAVDAPAFQAAAGDLLSQPRIGKIWKEAQGVGLVGTMPDEAAKAIRAYEQSGGASAYAAKLAEMTGQGVPLEKAQAALGPAPEAPAPSYEMLHDMKQQLDDATSAAFRQGRGTLGTRLASVRDAIDGFLSQNVPGYAQTNAEYARRLGLERALDAGANAAHINDLQGLQRQVASLSPDELAEFRQGLASKYVEELAGAKSNRDMATRLANAGLADQAKLRIVFGDEPTFQRFMRQMSAEKQLSQLKGATAGSPTARRLSNIANTIAGALGGVAYYAHNPLYASLALGTKGAQMGLQREMERQARQLAPVLTTTGAPAIHSILDQIAARRAVLSPALQQILGGVSGSAAPRLF